MGPRVGVRLSRNIRIEEVLVDPLLNFSREGDGAVRAVVVEQHDLGDELMAVRKTEQNDESKALENRMGPSSRGSVDAPGKRHRTPQPNEPIDKRMGERRGKQMGQKSVKNSPSGRR